MERIREDYTEESFKKSLDWFTIADTELKELPKHEYYMWFQTLFNMGWDECLKFTDDGDNSGALFIHFEKSPFLLLNSMRQSRAETAMEQFKEEINRCLKTIDSYSNDLICQMMFLLQKEKFLIEKSEGLNAISKSEYFNLPFGYIIKANGKNDFEGFYVPNICITLYNAIYMEKEFCNIFKGYITRPNPKYFSSENIKIQLETLLNSKDLSCSDIWILQNTIDYRFILQAHKLLGKIDKKRANIIIELLCKCQVPFFRSYIIELIIEYLQKQKDSNIIDDIIKYFKTVDANKITVIDNINYHFRLLSTLLFNSIEGLYISESGEEDFLAKQKDLIKANFKNKDFYPEIAYNIISNMHKTFSENKSTLKLLTDFLKTQLMKSKDIIFTNINKK